MLAWRKLRKQDKAGPKKKSLKVNRPTLLNHIQYYKFIVCIEDKVSKGLYPIPRSDRYNRYQNRSTKLTIKLFIVARGLTMSRREKRFRRLKKNKKIFRFICTCLLGSGYKVRWFWSLLTNCELRINSSLLWYFIVFRFYYSLTPQK